MLRNQTTGYLELEVSSFADLENQFGQAVIPGIERDVTSAKMCCLLIDDGDFLSRDKPLIRIAIASARAGHIKDETADPTEARTLPLAFVAERIDHTNLDTLPAHIGLVIVRVDQVAGADYKQHAETLSRAAANVHTPLILVCSASQAPSIARLLEHQIECVVRYDGEAFKVQTA